jgi:hypothetical protein
MANTIEETAKLMGRTHDIRFDRLMPGYHDRIQQAREGISTPLNASFLTLVARVSLFMLAVAICLYFAADMYGKIIAQGGNSADKSLRQISMGDDVISVPANMIRFRTQRNATNLDRLDLFVHWPTMSGYTEETAADFDSMDPAAPVLFISLSPRDMTKDMSGRITAIYEKFFSGPPVDAGNGLVRRPFSADSAFFNEDLYYEANSPYPYAARCIRESDRIAGPFCLRDIHVGRDTTLTYRFNAKLLPDWMAMDRMVRETVTAMMAN